ncbi:DUF3566 domain-containing protein [Cellulosimicrobium marinum]|uniref:DUF3566 domain-containing protein n=1 Tax=Cellulosimicrobium marinum TaxID=1638992 RepID=UPI001E378DD3|nr:DUF3566 domain-containing protein [Cellulosimicrobium marinum]MCB7135758.1 DUF3566 domain-containing protein [Cellulosimicrobium marinum]
MSSENDAPPAITPRLTVPRPDTGPGSGRPEGDGVQGNGRASGNGSTASNGHAPSARHGASATSTPPPPPPPPPSSGGSTGGDGGAASSATGGTSATEGMETASGESRVAVARAGAVKAAAAAIAAAKSAAKKVSATVPAAPPETDHDEVDDRTVKRMAPTAEASTGTATQNGTAASSMHYSAAGVTGTARPLTGATPSVSTATGATQAVRADGPRRVRLSVSRIDPWSAMKLGFLLAVAIGIMTVVAVAVFWYVLDSMLVFQTVQDFVEQIAGEESNVDITQFVEFGRVISLATLLSVVNVVIITALSTIMAFLYNIVAALVGGVHLTLTDD